MAIGYVKHEYRKTPNTRPRLIQSHKQFLVDLYNGEGGGGGGGIYGTIFMPRVFHACYLHLKKEEWNKTEKTAMLLQQNAILLVDNKQNT